MKSFEKCLKLIYCGPWLALLGSLLSGLPQSLAQNSESGLRQPLHLTVAPHTSSRIAMKTLPKAVCALHVDSDSDISRSFKLSSDDEGMIRFNVNPSEESDQVAVLCGGLYIRRSIAHVRVGTARELHSDRRHAGSRDRDTHAEGERRDSSGAHESRGPATVGRRSRHEGVPAEARSQEGSRRLCCVAAGGDQAGAETQSAAGGGSES